MKIAPETWKQVEPLFTAALDLPEAERAAWLEGIRVTHPALAPVLESLVAQHHRAEHASEMETVPKLASAPPVSSAFTAGDRLGPFRLVAPLGRGGMGEVWLAEQADGRVTREVALKLPNLVEAGEVRAERFGRERDILARLEHPHIAHLYDAGVSDRGQPYLAMERVQGEPLDAYVAARDLGITARLALFRQVLSAVAHAHRHLVVHRDLKPANILVDGSGQVKLLDFGIAKLLEDETVEGPARRDLTRIGGRLMTMRYAAPEQAGEGAITTATDIYSLGVVLHELVAGVSPYRAVRDGRPLRESALLGEEIALPSTVAKQAGAARALRGDLDAILLKALRRDPAARYASAEQFDDDIARHLERRPVAARAGTWRYLAGRFALRHRLPLAMGAVVVASLAVGLVVAERERREAVAEGARAERHFASVRKLANTFIFDVYGELEALAGSLKAREMLVKTSLEYLDSLSKEVTDDPSLMVELAAGYRRVASIQGQPGAANLGDLPSAVKNYEKAKRLFVEIERLRPDDVKALREHTNLSYGLARAYVQMGSPRWREEIADTVRLATRVASMPGATPRDRSRVGGALAEQAHLSSTMDGQTPEAEAAIEKATTLLEGLAAEMPDSLPVREQLASTHQRAGMILTGSRRTTDSTRRAVAHFGKALEILRGLRLAQPDDQRMPKIEMENLSALANAQIYLGDLKGASASVGASRTLLGELRAADPKNIELVADSLGVLGQAVLVAQRAGDTQAAIRTGREALAVAATLPEATLASRDVRNDLAEARAWLGFALMDAAAKEGDRARKLAALREARTLLSLSVKFVAEARAEQLGAFPEADVAEIEARLRLCEVEIQKLGG